MFKLEIDGHENILCLFEDKLPLCCDLKFKLRPSEDDIDERIYVKVLSTVTNYLEPQDVFLLKYEGEKYG